MPRMAVIVSDMLNDFVTGALKTDRALKIVEPIKKLVEAARKYGVPVIYSNDAHLNIDFEVVEKWGNHAIKGTPGAQVIPELVPTKNDFVVEKRVYSGFYETGLDSLLRSLYNGIGVETVILVGLHTHICVRHTAASAFYRGYKVVVPSDGVEAFTRKDQEEGLKYLRDIYNVEIKTVDEIVKEFEKNYFFSING
jgi:nicotinamidase-related amidase